MKLPILLSLLTLSLGWHAQNPSKDLDFGKYNKKIVPSPVKKSPKQRTYYALDRLKKINLSDAHVHYSKVFKGDTTSMSIGGYYVEFNTDFISSDSAAFTFYSDPVTNEDWNLFEKYCFDSVQRKALGWRGEPDKWLIAGVDENGDKLDKSEWLINWDEDVRYSKLEGDDLYIIEQFRYPEYERFYRDAEVDPRKLYFEYYWIDFASAVKAKPEISTSPKGQNQAIRSHTDRSRFIIREVVPLFRDSTLWVSDSSSLHYGNVEDGLVTHYNHDPYFRQMPVTGINQPQARAYLNWLSWNHNRYLRENGIPLFVEYELPAYELPVLGVPTVEIPAFDLSPWKISNSDYKAFVEYVRDSIALRILSYESPSQYLRETLTFSGEETYEEEWPIDWKSKIDWKRKSGGEKEEGKKLPYGILEEMHYPAYQADTNLIDKRKLIFEYYYYDHKTAVIGPFRSGDMDKSYCSSMYPDCEEKECIDWGPDIDCYLGSERFLGKDLDMSYVNSKCESNDVFSHQDRSAFIIKDLMNIYPGINYRWFSKRCDLNCQYGDIYDEDNPCRNYDCEMCPQIEDWENLIVEEYDFDSNPNDLVQGITYYQFRAYWWWWNQERRKSKDGNPVIADYMPSEEEFNQLWNGKSVTHPKETHQLPTPTFRYVIKFYSNVRGNY
jgi:formylglycine-generating enzyme required for sulfatase activity